jgi:hypothetical protein
VGRTIEVGSRKINPELDSKLRLMVSLAKEIKLDQSERGVKQIPAWLRRRDVNRSPTEMQDGW